MLKKLAIFDIDYTITRKETLMELFKYTIKNDKKNLKFLPRAAYCGLMYLMKFYDEKKVKETFLKFIDKIEEKDLALLVKNFYNDRLQNILYKDALNMMKDLKSKGYDIYLISHRLNFMLMNFMPLKKWIKFLAQNLSLKMELF